MRLANGVAVAVVLAAAATHAASDDTKFPEFEGPALKEGRDVWLGTCKNCHATGFADAPPVTNYDNWSARIEQPIETLYSHALNGFYGPDYAHMPPRGGNDALSDTEVTRAVDYMLQLVQHLHKGDSNDAR